MIKNLSILLSIFTFILPGNIHSLCLDEINKMPFYTCVQNKPIGEGSNGTVYLVKKDGTKYAMKVSQFNKNSKREYLVMGQLQGLKFVAQCEEYYEDSKKVILVLTYAPNGTMEDFMEQNDYFRQKQHKFLFMQSVLQGLKEIHDRGIVHADIKASNIGVDSDFNPVIMDFDLSVDIDTQSVCAGTLVYMAPEVAYVCKHGGLATYTASTDYFSWGMLMYKLFKQKLPFDMNTPDYYRLMSTKIKFKEEDPVDFYDNVFAVVKPMSSRVAYQQIKENIDQSVIKPRPNTLVKNTSYFLNEYANNEEKAYQTGGKYRYLLIWGSIGLIILFFVGFHFCRKRVNFKKEEGHSEETNTTHIIQ